VSVCVRARLQGEDARHLTAHSLGCSNLGHLVGQCGRQGVARVCCGRQEVGQLGGGKVGDPAHDALHSATQHSTVWRLAGGMVGRWECWQVSLHVRRDG